MQTRNVINISGLDKAEVLASLYNHAKILGMGFFGQRALGNKAGHAMTTAEAQQEIDSLVASNRPLRFDYLHGKPMKIKITGDELDASTYDEYNGEGTAAKAIKQIKEPSLDGKISMMTKLAEVKKDLKQDPDTVLAKCNAAISITAFYNDKGGNTANQKNNKADESRGNSNYCGLKKGFL